MENRTLAQIPVTAGFVANAVIDPVDEFSYVLAVTEGDLCTEVSIEPHLAASLGT
jgi:hypothetical protein